MPRAHKAPDEFADTSARIRRITFIGLGRMGLPIARNLLKAGFEVTGVDLSAERRQLFAAAGGAVSDDAGDASKGADLAVTILMSDLIVEQAALGAGGVLASLPVGAALCDLSTTSPKTAEHLRNAAFSTGRQFICAKVVGSVGLAESAGLTVCASGPRSLFDACDPVFSAMSSQAYYLGKAEEAAYLKLVHSLIVGIYSSMIGEALAFGRKGGLSLATMLDILEAGPLGSRQLTLKAPVLRERRFEAPPSDIDTAAKDMDLILDAARAISAPLPLSATVRQLMGAAQANGKGKRDIYAILETFEDLGGLDHA